jgi:CheY-like chemotaxis protein
MEGGMAKILVIDDDAALRRVINRTLTHAGHQVAEAEDGAQALRVFNANPADLVVTDIFMPQKEGIETILELRRDHPSVRILAISGNVDDFYLDFAQNLGAEGTLKKPFRAEELLREIDKLLIL